MKRNFWRWNTRKKLCRFAKEILLSKVHLQCCGNEVFSFVLQKEIEELRGNLVNISSASDDGAQKLKEEYLQKLNLLEAQVQFLVALTSLT